MNQGRSDLDYSVPDIEDFVVRVVRMKDPTRLIQSSKDEEVTERAGLKLHPTVYSQV